MSLLSSHSKPSGSGYDSPWEHIDEEMRWLDLVISRRVNVFRKSLLDMAHTGTGQQIYISHAEIDRLLKASPAPSGEGASFDEEIVMARQHIDARLAKSIDNGQGLPLVRLARMFQLTAFELQAIVVCLASEIDSKYDKIFSYLHDDIGRKRPSVCLILDLLCVLPGDRWRARAMLNDSSPLLRNELLLPWDEPGSPSGSGDLARFLRMDPAIFNFVLGTKVVDRRVDSAVSLLASRVGDGINEDGILRRLRTLVGHYVSSATSSPRGLVVNLHGESVSDRKNLALEVCRSGGWSLLCIDLDQLLEGQSDIEHTLRIALRQSLLWQAPVYLDNLDVISGRDGTNTLVKRIGRQLAQYSRLAFIGTAQPRNVTADCDGLEFHQFYVPFPDVANRENAWIKALNPLESVKSGWATLMARHFRLTEDQINEAVKSAYHEGVMGERVIELEDLFSACRRMSRHSLAGLATKIEPNYRWEQLVLPGDKLELMRELCGQLKYRYRVFEEWGFGKRLSHGKGLSALFTGPPGTGKTMSAEVIARELGLDMYKVELSAVVSKYIGETEKNLSKIFKEAESSNAILFFDEADALFGKRTEVADAHDRYANIETSYLLQKMEEFEGVVILASNLRENMDEAFVRRLRFIVDFPFPDEADRLRIWQTHFPAQAPLSEDVDFVLLSRQLQVAGGNIKNIVLNAAFLAAADESNISMSHILHSAKREFEKIGKRWDNSQSARLVQAIA